MRKILVIVSILLLVLFVLLSKYEDRNSLRSLDFAVTVKLQERIDRSSHLRTSMIVGNLMEGATFFASPEFTVIATLVMTGIALYDPKKKKVYVSAAFLPLALVALVLVEIYGKSIVHHPAPMYSMIKNPTTIFPANYINEQFSFPSGHAARAVFLAMTFLTLVSFRRGRSKASFMAHESVAIWACLISYVALVAVSRIYLGHHWLSDVVGGLLLGGGIAAGNAALVKPRDI